jgi:hypothetical protein
VGGFVPLDGFVLLNTSYQHGGSGHGSKSEGKNLFHGFIIFKDNINNCTKIKKSNNFCFIA